MLRPFVLTDRRPDQLAPTERAQLYLNTSLGHWCLPSFLVQKQEMRSSFVCHPHNPKTALRVDELLELCTAVVHENHSECYGDFSPFSLKLWTNVLVLFVCSNDECRRNRLFSTTRVVAGMDIASIPIVENESSLPPPFRLQLKFCRIARFDDYLVPKRRP